MAEPSKKKIIIVWLCNTLKFRATSAKLSMERTAALHSIDSLSGRLSRNCATLLDDNVEISTEIAREFQANTR